MPPYPFHSLVSLRHQYVTPSAINKFGSIDTLNMHLASKKKSALSTYATKSEDYRQAVSTRALLQEKGELDKAEAVVLASTGRKPPKAFPSYPGILLPSAGKRVDRRVACFEPRRMFVLGNEVVVEEPSDDDGDDDDDDDDDGEGEGESDE